MGVYWRGAIAALAVTAAGCISEDPGPVGVTPYRLCPFRIDSSMTEPAAVYEAVSRFNEIARRLVFVERPDGVPIISRPLGGRVGEAHYKTPAIYIDEAVSVSVWGDRAFDHKVVVLMHELGHIVGMRHVEAEGGIMFPILTVDSRWTPSDQFECVRVGICHL